jgi:diguanylate cyclase (GGDEF)-like protein
LERKGLTPVTIIIADLNGLKSANDQFGHAVGDALLRRAGEVLNALIEGPNHAARIGGDEFAILLPSTDANAGAAMMDAIQQLVEINNQFYPGSPLSFSMGAATGRPGERLEATAKCTDLVIFEAKRKPYAQAGQDQRREAATAA